MSSEWSAFAVAAAIIASCTLVAPQAVAQGPSIADQRAQRDWVRSCYAKVPGAAGGSPEKQQAFRDCLAKGPLPPPAVDPRQTAIAYEKAGRYAEAAALYQQNLNDSGMPDGGASMAGERLGYLLANGRGVPKNLARARVLFSASPYFHIDAVLLDHHLLPLTPEDKKPELIAKANAIVEAEQRKEIERQRLAEAQWEKCDSAWTPIWSAPLRVDSVGDLN
jgi:hypothetical protein